MNECTICCETFTEKVRKSINCSNCEFKACCRCHERYILDSNTEAKCMNCNHAWNVLFLHSNFSQAFVQRYRNHRTDILWQQQTYQLPIVTEYIAQLQNENTKYSEGQQLKEQLSQTRREILNMKHNPSARAKEKQLKQTRSKLHQQIKECNQERLYHANQAHRIRNAFVLDKHERRTTKRERPCVTENCKGFLDSEGKCPVCQKMTCMQCNISKTDDMHVCSQADVDTWNDLQKNTRPCPKCNTRIFKISGCDQMFCIQCNTGFSWKRGTIEQGPIHNPHYFEWLFSQRGQRPPNPDTLHNCNENTLPHFSDIRQRCRSPREEWDIGKEYRKIQHFFYVIMPRFSTNPGVHRRRTFEYLQMYLRNDAKAPKKFEECTRRFETDNEIYEVLHSYKRIQTHCFHSFVNRHVSYNDFMNQFQAYKAHYRNVLETTAKLYKRTIRLDGVFEILD